MDNRNIVLEINSKNEIIRIARGRQSALATLGQDNKTITWKDANLRDTYHKSVQAFLEAEGIKIETILLDGQKPDEVPANAPAPPKMHKMQGELTPAYLEWLMKWKPVAFTNLLGVELRQLMEGEKAPTDIRELWIRATVARTDSRPDPDAQGGQYIATRFKMENQIIARRASHLTFTRHEIYKGDKAEDLAEAYDDPHHPINLHKMKAQGKLEILSVRNAAASSGSAF